MYMSISDFLELWPDSSNSWTFPPGCLTYPSDPTYLKPNSFFSKQISSLHIANFVNSPLPRPCTPRHFDSCSPSPSITQHQHLVHPFYPSCYLHSSGPRSSHSCYWLSLLTSLCLSPALAPSKCTCPSVLILPKRCLPSQSQLRCFQCLPLPF